MASGMGRVAQAADDGGDSNIAEETAILETVMTVTNIEVIALSEAQSKEAAEILEDRDIASNPMRNLGVMCANQLAEDNGEEDEAKPKRRRRKDGRAFQKLAGAMPILTWLPKLRPKGLRFDLIAGITVGVMVIPQSMSYAAIAGLPYINGMYSASVPTMIYAFFGQSRQLAVGPVAMVSLLVEAGLRGALTEEQCPEWYACGGLACEKAQYDLCPQEYVNLASLTALVVGGMQIIGAVMKLGFLVSFLGHPVTSGFTSAAAIIIGLSQAKDMLGYDIPKSQYLYVTVWNILKDIQKLKPMPLFLGLSALGFLMFNKQFARKRPRFALMGPMGPLIACFFTTLLMWAVPALHDDFYVKYVGYVPDGLMPISSGWSAEMIGKVMPTAMSSCLIGYMESIAIGKNLASQHGYEIDAGQEMLALGWSNFVGSFFSCYPVTGSFSRSAVANQTGATSQFHGVVTSAVMFITLLFLTPLFYFLPKFVLAAIVMNSVMALVAFGEAKHLYRVKKHDFVLWVVAFIGTLFLGVLPGILVAMGLSLIIVIFESVRPQLTILWRIKGTTLYRNMKQESKGSFVKNVFICRIGSSLYFANAAYVKEMLLGHISDLEEVNPTEYVVLEFTAVTNIDSTACHVIHDIVAEFRTRGIQVAFAMVGQNVDITLRKAQLRRFIGPKWFFATVEEAVQYCLRHQHAKKTKQEFEAVTGLDDTAIDIGVANEIGFSNDLQSEHTMVFLTLAHQDPTVVGDVHNVFKENQCVVVRTSIEPLIGDGAKHTYFLKNEKTQGKLSDKKLDRVREDLEELVRKIASRPAPSGTESSKMKAVESTSTERRSRSKDSKEGADQQQRISDKERIAALEAELQKLGKKGQPGPGCGAGVVRICAKE